MDEDLAEAVGVKYPKLARARVDNTRNACGYFPHSTRTLEQHHHPANDRWRPVRLEHAWHDEKYQEERTPASRTQPASPSPDHCASELSRCADSGRGLLGHIIVQCCMN